MFKTSDQTDKLFAALALAQGAFQTIPKDKRVVKRGVSKSGKPFEYEYFYSAFETIIEHIRKPMADNGLAYIQSVIKNESGGPEGYCVTRIIHSSGQFYETTFPLVFNEKDMQQFGGVSTYGKRYGLTNALGLATDDDMDGNDLQNDDWEKSERPKEKRPEPKKPEPKAPEIVNTDMSLIDQITKMARIKGVSNHDLKKMIEGMGKKKSSECSPDELQAILAFLENK